MRQKIFDNRYARNSKGEFLVYKIRVLEGYNNHGARLIFEHGKLGGKLTYNEQIVAVGKNIGKANETTPFEQAISDAEGRILKKQHEGYKSLVELGVEEHENNSLFIYSEDIKKTYSFNNTNFVYLFDVLEAALPKNRTDKNGNIKPMKAQPYWKETAKGIVPRINFPCLAQPKINGVRAFLQWNDEKNAPEILSKSGLEYRTIAHLFEGLTRNHFIYNPANYYTFKWDELIGGIINIFGPDGKQVDSLNINNTNESDDTTLLKDYVKGYINDRFGYEVKIAYDGELYIDGEILSEIASAVKALSLKSQLVKFYMFDLAIENQPQLARLKIMKQLYDKHFNNNEGYVKVDTKVCKSHAEAELYTKEMIACKYEGAIFRDSSAHYMFGKRPQTMVKYKIRESAEFKIVDVRDSPKDPGLAIFVCRNDRNSLTFDVVPQGDHQRRSDYFRNRTKLIGKLLTVEFYERTINDLPFHCTGIVVRDYE